MDFMFLIVILGVLSDCNGSKSDRIFSGKPVNINDYPYLLSMQYNSMHFCGASIISANWALTSQMCLIYPIMTNTTEKVTLRSGSNYTYRGGYIHFIKLIIEHPESLNPPNHKNVAVMKVSPVFNIGQPGVNSVKISMIKPPIGSIATITGWGNSSFGSPNSILLATDLTVTNSTYCNYRYSHTLAQTFFCAEGNNICDGDYGNPIVLKSTKTLIGIVFLTFGNCTSDRMPTIFTSSSVFRIWLYKTTGV